MIYVFKGDEVSRHPEIFEQVYRLRHQVFVEELGWEDLRSPVGLEVDQFDSPRAVHHVCMRDGRVVGYQRMLPTLEPHLLSDVFPELCAVPPPRGPHIYELTRYCVAANHREGRRGVGSVGSELIAGFVEWGQAVGVSKVIIEFETNWVLRAIQLQFLARPLGFQTAIGKQNIVATELTIGEHTLETIRQYRGHFDPVLEFVGGSDPSLAPARALAS